MGFAAVIRSLHYSVGAVSNVWSSLERPCMVLMHNATLPTSNTLHIPGLTIGGKLVSSPIKKKGTLISCVKTSETAGMAKCDDVNAQGLLQKDTLPSAAFPNGSELGDFEMHLRGNMGVTNPPTPVIAPIAAPTVSAKPAAESAPAARPSLPPKPTQEKINPFTECIPVKRLKLPALEAGCKAYYSLSSEKGTQEHIVYLGAKPEGDFSAVAAAAAAHTNMLQLVFVSNFPSDSILYHYHRSFNGFVVKLTEEEVKKLARVDDVVSIFPDEKAELHTTSSRAGCAEKMANVWENVAEETSGYAKDGS